MYKVLKTYISIGLLVISVFTCSAQETPKSVIVNEIYSPSKKEMLSTDAYEVFKTNKFLDFKNKETLVEKIEGAVYKKMDLNDYFPNKKDWDKIEKEDITTFEKEKNAQFVLPQVFRIKSEFCS